MTGSIEAEAARLRQLGESRPRPARDPVNEPMINNWTEALGDRNPVYPELAPPAMVQVWTMYGLNGVRDADDPLGAMTKVLDDAGFTSVVATNCEQTYHRYLKPGERLAVTTRLSDVVGPKRTALGEGWFVTTLSTWYVGDEPVAEMMFRVLKFAPPEPTGSVIRPLVNQDTEFFWAGTAERELRIQRCPDCRALRHPPGPFCPRCGSATPDYVVSPGRGEVFSYVVHHHPPVPGKRLPIVIALVELEEGVRMLGELLDVSPDDVRIGQPVTVDWSRVDSDLTLPVWRAVP
ncbi:bifunctional MaoC family dehydratase N-terminal/OB-fold nucleic acid binding domain-containing protein [Kibdelosporangium phytohabitans]|uniref:DNA-binding protein n=1 Tax=Kibdelosporangium phytohabitans TaxID=860235 RepID=A0A0N9I9M6_9PSEU|nr:bifunctional MaoC family dehydratase N-terminal/OB-fold nucleic acid binding domain-containing protein [Kibdelosporangium phytohabitans]ALG12708.1 DNA-binding protein [Kibdelosporangium phytohabitans]MBE1464375.1 putative OB-fold protein [Kibdelosporangium phytohabitans]